MKIKTRVVSLVRRSAPSKHFCCFGGTGSGKDVYCQAFLQKKLGRAKVYDVLGFERGENMTAAMPMDYDTFIDLGKRLTNGVYKPKGIKQEVIVIYGKKFDEKFDDGTMKYDKVPANLKICTFRYSDLNRTDWINFLASTRKSLAYVQRLIDYLYDEQKHKFLTPELLLEILEKIQRKTDFEMSEEFKIHYSTMTVIQSNLRMMISSGIFDERFEHLNLIESHKHPEIMTTISCYFADSDLDKALTSGLLLKKIYELQTTKRHIIDTYVYLREIHIPYRSIMQKGQEEEDVWGLLRSYIYKMLTEGRQSLCWVIANTQNTLQIPDYIRQHFRKVFSFSQNKKGVEALLDYAFIDPLVIKKLIGAKKFIGIMITDGEWDYPCYCLPPTYKTKAAGEGVWDLLMNVFGSKDRSEYIKEDKPSKKQHAGGLSNNKSGFPKKSPPSISDSEEPPYSAI